MSHNCCSLAFEDVKEQDNDFVPELNIIVNVRNVNKTLAEKTKVNSNVVSIKGSFRVSF